MTLHATSTLLHILLVCVGGVGVEMVGMEVQVPIRVGGLVDHEVQAAVILTLEKYV